MSIFAVLATKFDDSGIRKAKREFGSLGKSIRGTLGAIGLGASLAGTVALVKESVTAAATDLRSQRLLATQLKRTVQATDDAIASNENWLSSLSMAVGVVDDELRPALAQAVRGTGSLAKGQQLLEIALDGAAATGKPLTAVMAALIKASNGQTMSLYRLAPELKKTKGGIDDFAKSVKGAAQTAADPFSRFRVATDELREKFGKLLLPTMVKFVDYLTKTVVPAVSDFIDQVGNPKTDVGKMFLDIKNAVKNAFTDVRDFFAMFGDGDAMKGFATVTSNLVKALPALAALKGILALAATGKAVGNLIAAVAAMRGTGGTGLPGAVVTGGKGGGGNPLPAILGRAAGTAGLVLMLGGDTQKNKRIPEDLVATGKATSGWFARSQGATIVVNSYGNTPDDFMRLVKKAVDKSNLVNGKKTN